MSERQSLFLSPYFIGVLAIFFAACMNTSIKGLSVNESVIMVTAWRYLFGAIYAGLLWLVFRPEPISFQGVPFHLFRGAFQVAAAGLFFWAVTQIPLATAGALGLTGTLMIGPLAWVLLGETMTKQVFLGTLAGFAGAWYIVFSETDILLGDFSGHLLGYLSPMLASLCLSVSVVLLRFRAQTESPIVIAFFANTLPALYVLPIFFIFEINLSAMQLSGYALAGLFGLGYWTCTTFAYARAPAARIAPLTNTNLIFASIMGFIFFNEIPPLSTWIGAIIIVVACIYVARVKEA